MRWKPESRSITITISVFFSTLVRKDVDVMNGFSAGEEDSRGPPEQVCCLVDDGFRCHRPAGNASYSKRIQKTVTQRRLKLHLDLVVCSIYELFFLCK